MRYVYILKGYSKHYVGYTSDLESRFKRHQRGHTRTTKGMGDLKIVGYFEKETKQQAIQLERKIKKNGHIDHWINHETFITYH